MSEGSNEPGQVWGEVVASERSPPLSPALTQPPGQPDGQGTVRPHQFSNSIVSSQNPFDTYATRDPRLEPFHPISTSHAAVLLTSSEEVAAQRSMMAADQLSREELRAIRHANVEIHGRLPALVSENLAGADDGITTPADGRRVSCSVDSLPPRMLVFGDRGAGSSYGQTMLTPIGMTSFEDTVAPAEGEDEQSGRAILANNKASDLIYGREVQNTFTQQDAQRESLRTIPFSPDSNISLASQLAAYSPSTPSSYDYQRSSQQPTIKSQPPTPSHEAGVHYQQHNRGRLNNIPEGWDFQHGPSQSTMQASDVGDATGLDSTNPGHFNVTAQDGNPSSSVSTLANTSLSTIGDYDQLEVQRAPEPPHMIDSYGNSTHAIASNQDPQLAIFNAVASTGISNEVDLMDGLLQSLPESTLSHVENHDFIATNTEPDSEMTDHSQTSAQEHHSIDPSILQQLQQTTPVSSQSLPGGLVQQSNLDGTDVDPPDIMIDDFERNLDVTALLAHWTISYGLRDLEFPPVGERALRVEEWKRPDEVQTKDLNGDYCDPQGINWVKLGTTRENARTVRNKLYVNYTNIEHACPSEVSVRCQALALRLTNLWL